MYIKVQYNIMYNNNDKITTIYNNDTANTREQEKNKERESKGRHILSKKTNKEQLRK